MQTNEASYCDPIEPFIILILFNCLAWLSYLNVGMLIGTLALALFNASEDTIAQNFAYLYALISIGVLVDPIFFLCLKHKPGAHIRV